MKRPAPSAAAAHRERQRAFLAAHAGTCAHQVDLRQEGGKLVCALCDAPVKKRPEIVDIVWAPRCPACRGATIRCLRCRQLYALRGGSK
jgi:hypothetical protein